MAIIGVDFQKDFTAVGGACYETRPCVEFIRKTFIPHCRRRGFQLAEIVSDYRPPRPGAPFQHCVPGSEGYQSELPQDIKQPQEWVKCMHSPVWVRDNGGVAELSPGPPRPDPAGFSSWLAETIGPPRRDRPIILIGLTLDCCLLCTAQELFFRGYGVEFLVEGVDTYSGSQEEKQALFLSPLANWGRPVSWQTIRERRSL